MREGCRIGSVPARVVVSYDLAIRCRRRLAMDDPWATQITDLGSVLVIVVVPCRCSNSNTVLCDQYLSVLWLYSLPTPDTRPNTISSDNVGIRALYSRANNPWDSTSARALYTAVTMRVLLLFPQLSFNVHDDT